MDDIPTPVPASPSDPIPTVPTPSDAKSAKKDNSNLVLGILSVLLLAVVSGVIWVYTTPQNSNTSMRTTYTSARTPEPTATFTPTPVPTVILVEKYDNPFDEKVQYENPFEDKVNPFDVLTL